MDIFPETDKSVYVLSEHEMFMREFIALYKQNAVLWCQKHPHYRNRAERSEAYEVLVKKCREYYPDADEDFARMKIDSMRSTFRKEHRKVVRSKEIAASPEEVHKPSLWYYDLLLFVANETDENTSKDETRNQNNEDGSLAKIAFWNREYSAIMIDLYKIHPCLYSASHPHGRSKRRRKEAVRKITNSLIEATGKYFQVDDVRKKISMIRGQFLHEYKKVKKGEAMGEIYQPSLWCYEMLSFLKDQYCDDKRKWKNESEGSSMDLRKKMRRQRSTSEESGDDDMDIKKESDGCISPDSSSQQMLLNSSQDQLEENDDIFDTIAKNVAHKLRNMTSDQRTVAERIVKDVMYHGQMENLTADSHLSLEGT